MTFEQVLDQALAMLHRRGRVTYQTLHFQFELDDECLEALKDALLFAHSEITDEDDRGLVWTGDIPDPAQNAHSDTDKEISFTGQSFRRTLNLPHLLSMHQRLCR